MADFQPFGDADSFERFMRELSESSEAIKALSQTLRESIGAQRKVVDQIGQFYQQGGVSQQASQGPTGDPQQQADPTSESRLSSKGVRGALGWLQNQFDPTRHEVPAASVEGASYDRTRERLIQDGMDPAQIPPDRWEGYTPPSWASYSNDTHQRDPIPQFGEYQADSILNYAGDVLGAKARRRFIKSGGDDSAGRGYATAGFWLHKAAEYAPALKIAQRTAAYFGYDIRPDALESLGSQVGATGGGNVGSNSFGFRLPYLNPEAIKGAQEEFEQMKYSFRPGLNKEQAGFFFNQLYERGWMGGNQTNHMRDASADIMQYSKALGMDPQTYDLMDKAARLGQSSLNDFVKTIKKVPDVAKAAHVSMDQMLSDMDQIGEQTQAHGGTHFWGQEKALAYSRITGLPAGVIGGAMNNPLVSGQLMLNTGLAPWEQGLAGPGADVQAVLDSVNSMMGATAGIPGRKYAIPGAHDGAALNITSNDRRIAQLHMMYPELSPEVLRQLTNSKNQRGIKTAASLSDAMTAWTQGARTSLGSPWSNGLDFWGQRDPNAANAFTWHEMENRLRKAKGLDGSGHLARLFSDKEIEEIRSAGGKIGHYVKGHYETQDFSGGMKVPGMVHREWVKGAWSGGHSPEQVAKDRADKFRELMAKKSDNQTDGPKVTIELSDEAAKKVSIKGGDKGGRVKVLKLGQNAGSAPYTNSGYAGGYTDSPMTYLNP